MSLTSVEPSQPAIQSATPVIHLGADLLDAVQAATPRPPADAPVAWQHPSRPHLIAAIAAYKPTDAAQASLAGQLVAMRMAADDLRWQSSAPDLPARTASRLRRTSVRTARAAAQLERALRRLQAIAAQQAGASAEGALDAAALIALWQQGRRPDRPDADPIRS